MRSMTYFSILALLVALLFPGVARCDVTFTDSEFNLSDWDVTNITFGPGGDCSMSQTASGGNPGSFGEVTVNTYATEDVAGGIIGFLRNLAAIYDPQAQGAILSVDYMEDAKWLWSEIHGQGATTGAALRQDGIVYIQSALPWNNCPEDVWTPKNRSGLSSEDFAQPLELVYGSADTTHPDFSAEGSIIEFGFFRWNSRPAHKPDGRTHIVGIDNWNLTVINGHSSVPSMNRYGITILLLLIVTTAIVVVRRCKTGTVT